MITYGLLKMIGVDVLKGVSEEQIKSTYINKIYSSRDDELALYAIKNPPAPISFHSHNIGNIKTDVPAIYESVAYPGKKIKVLTTRAWSFVFDQLGMKGSPMRYSPEELRNIFNKYFSEMQYNQADIDEALDIFEQNRANQEVSNEATEINRYFNDNFYHISKDTKFIQYVCLAILIIGILLGINFIFGRFL